MRVPRLLPGLAIFALAAHTANNPAPSGTRMLATAVPYASGDLDPAIRPQAAAWLTANFAYIVDGGLDLSPHLHSNLWARYLDSAYIYAPSVYAFNHDVAAANGFANAEDLFLHIGQDYAVSPALAWQHLDQFDYFEQPGYLNNGSGSPAQAVNGAFTESGNVYADVTSNLYDGTHETALRDKLMLGYAEPFDTINVTLKTARAGGSVAWEYWSGRWTALALRSDTTAQFTSTGSIRFNPPANWRPAVFRKSRPKFWVRAVASGASASPVIARIYGDDWAAHTGTNNCRGWSATAPNRINVGLGNLEYNPAPPANATARFRYQARATGMWAPDAMFGNPSDKQNGKLTWATYLVSEWTRADAATGFHHTGAFFDDAGTKPQITSPALPIEKLADLRSGDWSSQILAEFLYIRSKLRASRGPNFKVGANVSDLNLALQLDFSMNELSGSYPRTGNVTLSEADRFLPAANPAAFRPIARAVGQPAFRNRGRRRVFHGRSGQPDADGATGFFSNRSQFEYRHAVQHFWLDVPRYGRILLLVTLENDARGADRRRFFKRVEASGTDGRRFHHRGRRTDLDESGGSGQRRAGG